MRRWACLLCLQPLLVSAAPPPRVVVSSPSHPAVQTQFDSDLAPLAAQPVGDEPPVVQLRRVEVPGRGGVLEATNTVSGGYFGLSIYKPARQEPVPTELRFDYRADPAVKVNLLLRVRHQDYEIGFTGPPCDTGQTIWLGQAADIVADGAWHTARVPLLRMLRRELAWSDLKLTELSFENRHTGDYLLAGFGGNGQGSRLALDNLWLGRPGPAGGELSLSVPGATAEGYAVVLDRAGETVPPTELNQTSGTVKLSGLTDGEQVAHVRAKVGGVWGPPTHYRFLVDATPPTVGATVPAAGAKACPRVWTANLQDAAAGVAPQTITAQVADRTLGVEDPSGALRYDPLAGELRLQPALAGLSFKAGETVTWRIAASDELGQAMPPQTASFVFDPSLDRDGPEQARLLIRQPGQTAPVPFPGDGSFEDGLDEWRPFGSAGTLLERTTATAASGRYSLRLRCTENGSDFSTVIRRTPFNAARFRVLSFDYKAPERLRVDLLLRWRDRYYRVRFTDRDEDETVIGVVPGVVADDQWHHAEVPLYELLAQRDPRATDFTIAMLLFTGGPWTDAPRRFKGNYAGTEFHIDNFSFVPMLGADAELAWSGVDQVGVSGAELLAASDPKQLPAADAPRSGKVYPGSAVALDQLPQGLVYVWTRLLDAAGNASRPLVNRVLIDAGRPQVGAVSPAAGSAAAPATIAVELRDDQGAGLDLGSLELAVAGVTYRVDDTVLRYDRVGGKLLWDGRRATPPVVLPDGQSIACRLLEARDLAGNRPTALPAWTFTMRYADDRVGPEVEVSSRTHAAFATDTFDGRSLPWRPEPAAAAALTLVPTERPDGGRALRLQPAAGEGQAVVWTPFERQFGAYRFGLLSFDYRLPAGLPCSLLLKVRNAEGTVVERALALAGTPFGQSLGNVPGIVADGTWQSVIVNLYAALQRDGGLRMPYIVEGFGFILPRGAAAGLTVDNLSFFREATSKYAKAEWSAYDETGVVGYSVVVDAQPHTLPEPRVSTTDRDGSWQLTAGLSYLHVRAVDGAGNWGAPTHFLLKTP
ncbi:MAG: hypothetical protein IT204_00300 [Fimbriimonadaceae bacterium]|nr:hypothetical protein [Fimbriimonadaceae bacterium]